MRFEFEADLYPWGSAPPVRRAVNGQHWLQRCLLSVTVAVALYDAASPAHAGLSSEENGPDQEWSDLIDELQDEVDDLADENEPPDPPATTTTALVDCSVRLCTSNDQRLTEGYRLFDQDNFATVVDGFGRPREFKVHIPARYDDVNGTSQKVPLVFAFHGGNQPWDAMVAGKWDEHFEQEIAFVFPADLPDPCENAEHRWIQPAVRPGARTPQDPNCDPLTQVLDTSGGGAVAKTYWNSSLPGSFADVAFVEPLRAMILERFPKLNAHKVYATGFSSGSGLSYALLCYRSNLFAGFSMVAKNLGRSARGDYENDGAATTSPDSLLATCGKNILVTGRATGIELPQPWGPHRSIAGIGSRTATPVDGIEVPSAGLAWNTEPVVLFAGDQDFGQAEGVDAAETLADIISTTTFIRSRNNLSNTCHVIDPYRNVGDETDRERETQRCTFKTPAQADAPHSVFRRFLVRGGTHAMPDADECNRSLSYFMTCDYDYTDETVSFFEEFAGLSLDP